MSFKKIVVPVTGAHADSVALATGFAVARLFCGHVEALFVRPDPREVVPFVGMPVSAETVQQIIQNAEDLTKLAAEAAHTHFVEAAKMAGAEKLASAAPVAHLACSFREVHGAFAGQVIEAAQLADLVVFGAPMPDGSPDLRGAFIDTLTKSGRPVLLGAAAPTADLARKIAIGWDGSAAAAHALGAALPLLEKAGCVDILSVQPPPGDMALPQAAADYLALHGIAAETQLVDPGARQPAEALLEAATAGGASLLVAGGYGHSRLFEMLFGGATVHISAHATLPLFMAH